MSTLSTGWNGLSSERWTSACRAFYWCWAASPALCSWRRSSWTLGGPSSTSSPGSARTGGASSCTSSGRWSRTPTPCLRSLADKNEKGTNGQLFKMKADPRITRVGRFLRKWSLDELPQVINVYKGEMSLVGPRPPLPREVENYCSEHYCRLKGLPGITGLWQVSGRSDLSFEEMVKLDKYYLDNWSLRLDLSIMLKTIVVVLGRQGAY